MHHFEQHKLKAIFFPVKFYFLIYIGPDIEKIVCAAPRRALKSRKKLRYLIFFPRIWVRLSFKKIGSDPDPTLLRNDFFIYILGR